MNYTRQRAEDMGDSLQGFAIACAVAAGVHACVEYLFPLIGW